MVNTSPDLSMSKKHLQKDIVTSTYSLSAYHFKHYPSIHNGRWVILRQSPLKVDENYITEFNMGSKFNFVSTKEASRSEAALTEIPKEAKNYKEIVYFIRTLVIGKY